MSTPYHAKYFAFELTKRCASDSMEKLAASLADAQVDLNPHQVEAALFAFRSPLSKGAILADEVGLGKTIEAGILLSQKWAERKRKVLVIVPASLRKQWHQELSDKFFLPSVLLETKTFNEQIRAGNLNPFDRSEIVICSFQFARSKEPYIRQVPWNLAVIDEAHRLRNVYTPSNKMGNSIKSALAPFDKLLLTATPLQNSLLELFGLVSIIDEHIFGDVKSFRAQFSRLESDGDFQSLRERLKPICQRTLRRQVLEYIPFTNRIAVVEEFVPSDAEQKLYNLVSDYLQRPNLYALPASQRQLMTLILRRLLASSTFAIAGTLEGLANKLDEAARSQEPVEEPPSEVADTFEAFEELSDEWEEEEDEDDQDEDKPKQRVFTPEEMGQVKAEIQSLRLFTELAKSILRNSKGERLLTALKRGLAEAKKKGGSEKAIIFTESTRTQEYVRSILESTAQYKGKVVLFNGSNNDPKSKGIYQTWLKKHEGTDRITGSKTADKRAALVDYFRDEAVIMVATEAAAEGINLQFCSLVINYDLPWNPQRIEQRIGRCHRYGQKHDVVVVNFLNKKNAADQRVYQLLDEKFKLFNGVFGASDEVLGHIGSGIDFEKRIAGIYQMCRTEEQIQFNFDQLQQEMEQQIDERMRQTRQKLLENFDEEVHEKLRVNLRESSEALSKYDNWLWELTRFYLRPYARFEDGGNRFTLIKNPFPEEQIHPGPYRSGKNVEGANLYRLGHPLAQKIIAQCKAFTPDSPLAFDYSHSGKKISILESFIGQSGFMRVTCQTVTALETEDFILLSGVCDDGTPVDSEQCRRFFSLAASEQPSNCCSLSGHLEAQLDKGLQRQQNEVLAKLTERNAKFFEIELDKLDRWSDDLKVGLEQELKELDRQIREARRSAQIAAALAEKLAIQKQVREFEAQRNRKRRELFDAQDRIDKQRQDLIETIEKRLRQDCKVTPVFTLRWSLF